VTNFIKDIYKFNKENGLITEGYNSQKEIAYLLKKTIEDTNISSLAAVIGMDNISPDDVSQAISTIIHNNNTQYQSRLHILNKHINIVISSIGALCKLGLSPQQIQKAICLVTGKFISDTDPDLSTKFQNILDTRPL